MSWILRLISYNINRVKRNYNMGYSCKFGTGLSKGIADYLD
jgi:hypothetical protein